MVIGFQLNDVLCANHPFLITVIADAAEGDRAIGDCGHFAGHSLARSELRTGCNSYCDDRQLLARLSRFNQVSRKPRRPLRSASSQNGYRHHCRQSAEDSMTDGAPSHKLVPVFSHRRACYWRARSPNNVLQQRRRLARAVRKHGP